MGEIVRIVKKTIKHMGSVTALANHLGINRSSISRWIHRVHVPSANYLLIMQNILETGEFKGEKCDLRKRKKKST